MSYAEQITGKDPQGNNSTIAVSGVFYERYTNLAANESFSTPWFDIQKYNIDLYIETSHAGTRILDYSADGNTVLKSSSVAVPAGIVRRGFSAQVGRYARYTYTNGPTATTTFLFRISLRTDDVQPAVDTLDDTMSGSTFAQEVKASIALKDSTSGIYSSISGRNGLLPVDMGDDAIATVPLSGGVGVRGWLSSLYDFVRNGTLKVQVQNTSLPVTGTFYQSTQPVSGTVAISNFPATQTVSELNPSTATVSNVTTLATVTTVLAANPARRGATFNSVTGTILLKLGTGASATSYSARLVTNSYYELPQPAYTGVITAIGAGTLTITEITN